MAGVTIISFLAFAYQQFEELARVTAKSTAEAEIGPAVEAVANSRVQLAEAEDKVNAALQEFENLKAAIQNAQIVVNKTEQDILDVKLQAVQVLEQVNAIKGGIIVVDAMSGIQKDLNDLRLTIERERLVRGQGTTGSTSDPDAPQPSDPAITIEGIFPGDGTDEPTEDGQ